MVPASCCWPLSLASFWTPHFHLEREMVGADGDGAEGVSSEGVDAQMEPV
jgi:hypothetical protein